MSPTPALWWKLDETSGTVAADSAGSNPGTYSAGIVSPNGFISQISSRGVVGSFSFAPSSVGATTGDVVLAVVISQNAANTVSTPTGWTKEFEVHSGTRPMTVTGFSRNIGASEPTVTFTNSSGSINTVWSFVNYRGLSLAGSAHQGWDAGDTATAPGGTTISNDGFAVCFFAGDTNPTGTIDFTGPGTTRSANSAVQGTTGECILATDIAVAPGTTINRTASVPAGEGIYEFGWQVVLQTGSAATLPTLGQPGPAACLGTSHAPHFTRIGTDPHGVGDNVMYVHTATPGPMTGAAWAATLWYKQDSAVNAASLFEQRDWTQAGPTYDVDGLVGLVVLNGNQVQAQLSNGTITPDVNTFSLAAPQQRTGCWHLAVIRRTSGGLVEVVFDRVTLGSWTNTHSLVAAQDDVAASAFNAVIPGNHGPGDQFDTERLAGYVGNLKLYNAWISDADIAAEWATGCPCVSGFISIGMLRL